MLHGPGGDFSKKPPGRRRQGKENPCSVRPLCVSSTAKYIFEISPLVMAIDPDRYYDLLIKISPQEISKSIGYIHSVFKDTAPDFPFRYEFMDDFLTGFTVPCRW
jgi:uncharacterized protein (DUF1499 family)